MKEEEALRLLLGTLTMNSIDKRSEKYICAQKIVTELDRMPLAINLARAYIDRTRTTFKVYINRFEDQKKRGRLLDYNKSNDSDQYKHTVATVWQLSFDQIQALNPITTKILNACAFLYPERIPVYLFKQQWTALELIDILPNEQEDSDYEEIIGEVITTLVEFSFVTREESFGDVELDVITDLLTIHRLVQTVIRDAMTIEQKQHWHQCLATAFQNEIVSSDYHDLSNRHKMDAYIPHFHHFVQQLGDDVSQPIAETVGFLLC